MHLYMKQQRENLYYCVVVQVSSGVTKLCCFMYEMHVACYQFKFPEEETGVPGKLAHQSFNLLTPAPPGPFRGL